MSSEQQLNNWNARHDPAFLKTLVGMSVKEAEERLEAVGLMLRAVPPDAIVTHDLILCRVNATTDADGKIIVSVEGFG